MSIAVDADHLDLAEAARDFAQSADLQRASKERLEDPDATSAVLEQVAELGWLGAHVPESLGGSGFGLIELSTLIAELGGALMPGAIVPTTAVSAVIAARGSEMLRGEGLTKLMDGSASAAFGVGGSATLSHGVLSGELTALGSASATTLLAIAGDEVVILPADRQGLNVVGHRATDLVRDFSRVTADDVAVSEDEIIVGGARYARGVLLTLLAADSAGIARATLDTAVQYVKGREQFGRPVGSFQAVKHHCANMLVNAESAEAAAWGAARAVDGPEDVFVMMAATAAVVASESAFANAETNIHLHGGMGFTWEHDAHLHYRRAIANRSMSDLNASAAQVLRSTIEGARLNLAIALPEEVEAQRSTIRAQAKKYAALEEDELRTAMRNDGYLVPNWPAPWGMGASPALLTLIDNELARAGTQRPSIGYAAFLALTIVNRGTADQVERWIPPVLDGCESWCQLFSEPGAGSDAAGIQTRGRKVEGGWILNGQKVWSSGAHLSRWGLATVRTDPDAAKHAGITMMVVDMRSSGVDVRPLRQITGESHFNETFLDDVFVPDDNVIGEPGQGWPLVRETLGNERSVLGDGAGPGPLISETLALLERNPSVVSDHVVGSHIAREFALRLMNFRRSLQTLAGGDASALGAVTKLVGSLHGQDAANLNVQIVGTEALFSNTAGGQTVIDLLSSRRFTIAGGTSEITRNQIAERLLGLPRESQTAPTKRKN